MYNPIHIHTLVALTLGITVPAFGAEPDRLPSGAGLPVVNAASSAGVNPLTSEALEAGRLRTALSIEQLRTRIEKERLEQAKMHAEGRMADIDAARKFGPTTGTSVPAAGVPAGLPAAIEPKPRVAPRAPAKVVRAGPPAPPLMVVPIPPPPEPVPPRLLALLRVKGTQTALVKFDGIPAPKEVQVGETVSGYRVLSISDSGVSVSREPGGQVALLAMAGGVGRLAEADTPTPVISAAFASIPTAQTALPGVVTSPGGRPIQPPVPMDNTPGYPNPLDIGKMLLPPPRAH